jgi:hypothetical protein
VVGMGETSASGYRLDGKMWSAIQLSPGKRASGYSREPNGTEWVAMHTEASEGESRALEVWSRKPAGAWLRIKLPSLSRKRNAHVGLTIRTGRFGRARMAMSGCSRERTEKVADEPAISQHSAQERVSTENLR